MPMLFQQVTYEMAAQRCFRISHFDLSFLWYGLMTSVWFSECIRTSISLIIYIQQPRLIFTVQINPILRCWCGTVQSGVIYACVFSPDECRAFNVVSPMYDDKRNGIFKQTGLDLKSLLITVEYLILFLFVSETYWAGIQHHSRKLIDRPICHLFGFIEIKQKFKAVYNFLTSDLSL